MTKQPFAPKDANTIKNEIITELGIDYEANQELVDKMVERELKSEQFKASLHADKEKHLGRKEFYKEQLLEAGFTIDPQTGKVIKPKGAGQPKLAEISSSDKAYLYAKLGYSRTEVRHLEKVMMATGKSWEEASKDNLFITFKKDNDALIARRGAALPASRGGGTGNEESDQSELVQKFAASLPKGFSYTKKK